MTDLELSEGLDFEDVLLVPRTGCLRKRADADISSFIAGDTPIDIPIISANMPSVTGAEMAIAMWQVGGCGALHRFNTIDEAAAAYVRVSEADADAICSLGLHDGLERADALYAAGAEIFLLDVAHGDHFQVFSFIESFRRKFKYSVGLIVGNVATYNGAIELARRGVDAIKVGIGPGRVCTTRSVTGFGVPQLTAIMEVRRAIGYQMGPRVIADGGVRSSGDIVKALAAGADTVMIGSLLAGCDEAPYPGEYFGNASRIVNGHRAPEGTHATVERTGPVADTIKSLAWGIRSGVSYGGATNLRDLRKRAKWVKVRRVHG